MREEVDVLDVVVRLPLALVFLFRFPGRARVRGGDGGGRDRASAEGEKRRRRRRRAMMIRWSSFVAAAFDAHRRRDEGEEEEDAETIARSDAMTCSLSATCTVLSTFTGREKSLGELASSSWRRSATNSPWCRYMVTRRGWATRNRARRFKLARSPTVGLCMNRATSFAAKRSSGLSPER